MHRTYFFYIIKCNLFKNVLVCFEALMFTKTTDFDPKILKTEGQVRTWCENNVCHVYGKNWSCPPLCGSLPECEVKMHSFEHGILLETTGKIKGKLDVLGYTAVEKQHLNNFYEFIAEFRMTHPDALYLGAGGCKICKNCAYPEPCRFPERRLSSMEGYGLLIKDVCEAVGTSYSYGDKTITYFACVLYND